MIGPQREVRWGTVVSRSPVGLADADRLDESGDAARLLAGGADEVEIVPGDGGAVLEVGGRADVVDHLGALGRIRGEIRRVTEHLHGFLLHLSCWNRSFQ